jgi:glycerol-3-phosphate dehydrogenase
MIKAADPSAVTRDYVLDLDPPGGSAPILSIFGGKITTYRKLAEHAQEKLTPFFPRMPAASTCVAPLPGGDFPDADFGRFLAELRRRNPWLPSDVASGYARRYGRRVERLLAGTRSLDDLGRHFGAGFYEREARFLIDHEWAMLADDILERRTKHGLHLTRAQRQAFEAWLSAQPVGSAQ